MNNVQVIERLKSLEAKSGVLTPDDVLSDAKDPKSPLHDFFEWDDEKAAHRYRVDQARALIRSVRLVISEEKHQLSVVGYVRSPGAENNVQGYVSTVSLRSDKDRARMALIREVQAAEYAMARAYDVADAVGLTGQVEQILAMIRNVKQSA